jgi:hypothetical protein
MKNTSLTSILGFVLSLPVVFFLFLHFTDSVGEMYGRAGLAMVGAVAAFASALSSLISLAYVFRGSRGKYLTFIALAIDAFFFMILFTQYS